MRRTQVQLDEEMYQALRRRAYRCGCSISAVVREVLARVLRPPSAGGRRTLKQFPFVACGKSDQGSLSPVSERHDEALAEAFGREHGK
jgi:hypothetical protein